MKRDYETKFTSPDYKAIRYLSHRIDCTVMEADFNTNRPNPRRIPNAIGDIGRYSMSKGEKFYGFKY